MGNSSKRSCNTKFDALSIATVIFSCSQGKARRSKKHVDERKQRNKKSKKIDCPFHIAIRSPAKLYGAWYITTHTLKHTHEPRADTHLFCRQKMKLPEEARAKIDKYLQAKVSHSSVLQLLRVKWPGQIIDPRTITNAIQNIKRSWTSPVSLPPTPEVTRLFDILQERQSKEDDFFVRFQLDDDQKLTRIFWIDRSQRLLYNRYRDCLVSDNTSRTNRFNMSMNAMAIVDNDGKSRLVACALTAGESKEDYAWVLTQLMAATGHNAPAAIILDEDPAMEAACSSVLKSTVLINCLWHLGCQNLQKNLRGRLANEWIPFSKVFWATRNTFTPQDFEKSWNSFVKPFGTGRPQVEEYLERLYKNRSHWAWPWVGSTFTVGMQSTQRVEGIHAAIKKLVDSKTPLAILFASIQQKLEDEELTTRLLRFRAEMELTSSAVSFAQRMFTSVLEVNDKFLGTAAISQMLTEMTESSFYDAEEYHVSNQLDKENRSLSPSSDDNSDYSSEPDGSEPQRKAKNVR